MSTTLEQKLNLILNEKQTKIIPENIKAGVTILGVTGTYIGEATETTVTTDTATEETTT